MRTAAAVLRPDGRLVLVDLHPLFTMVDAVSPLRLDFPYAYDVIPNGIDSNHFSPDAAPVAELVGDHQNIVFCGRFDPRNGLDTMIEAYRLLYRDRGDQVRLVVIGDGPLRKHYYRAAGGDPDITFVGSVLHERPSYYAHSAMYACPTTKASFGITLLESMACETPVVCSDIYGFRDVVKHEREALMVHCGNQDDLADALVRLLDDETLRARLGKRGRQEAENYSWTKVTEAVLDIYTAVLGRNAHE